MPQDAGAPGKSIDQPIFVAGSTRSGTTLLSLMLGHHPDIAFVGEFEWVWDFGIDSSATELTTYYDWLRTQRHFRHHGLQVDRKLGFDDLVGDFLRQMRDDFDPRAARTHVGCQCHRNYAQALARWPEAKFIHIVRDGRDVGVSWMRLGWLGNAYAAGLSWRNSIAEWAAVKPRIDPARRVELRFEDLLQSPEDELARLCEFIGVPYSDTTLRYHEDTTYETVDPGQASKWRSQLSRRDQRVFEAVAGAELVANGYALSGEPPLRLHPWSTPQLRLENLLRHHRSRIRNVGLQLWLADILTRRLGLDALQNRVKLALNDIENARMK